MATLNELKTQITNANALGIEKITNKGGTVAQNADTVTIMNAIDSIPSGGGSAPTIVTEITWDGNTEGKESVDIGVLAYKVSDDILPLSMTIAEGEVVNGYTYSMQSEVEGEAAKEPSSFMLVNGVAMYGLNDRGGVVCVEHAGAEVSGSTFPSAGTWTFSIDGHHIASITATATE